MAISLKETKVVSEMADLLYHFLPGSGSSQWKGHVTFPSVANEVGLGEFWQSGSKKPAITELLVRTLEHRRDLFEKLILTIVKEGLKYCQKNNEPITDDEIRTLNGLIMEVGFKFPSLCDPAFIDSLQKDRRARSSEIVEPEPNDHETRMRERLEFLKRLEIMKSTLYSLWKQPNRQQAGFELERLLNDLFELYGLNPRSPFKVLGEQIDGSFVLDNEIYLFEAKWESTQLPEAPLLIFRGKIEGKASFTRGLFLSLNGYTGPALAAITQGKQPNFFLMDGFDLNVVLGGQIGLDTLLRTKLRILAEEGRMFVSAKEIVV